MRRCSPQEFLSTGWFTGTRLNTLIPIVEVEAGEVASPKLELPRQEGHLADLRDRGLRQATSTAGRRWRLAGRKPSQSGRRTPGTPGLRRVIVSTRTRRPCIFSWACFREAAERLSTVTRKLIGAPLAAFEHEGNLMVFTKPRRNPRSWVAQTDPPASPWQATEGSHRGGR